MLVLSIQFMITIKLIRRKADNLYYPTDHKDKMLMQHCMNEDLETVNNNGLAKVQHVANMHGWEVRVFTEE